MKRKILISSLVFILITSVFVSLGACKETNRGIFYVGGIGNGNYSNIQEAITLASSGDTILVYNGTYYQNIVINKSINLEGQDKNNTVIDGQDNSYVVLINCSMANISGFTIQNGVFGIFISGSNILSENTITSNIVKCNINGIYLQRSSYGNIVSKNIVTYNAEGIRLYNSSNNTIINNTIEDNVAKGLMLWERSENNLISGNNIAYNSNGVFLKRWSNNNSIKNNNIINNEGIGISLDFSSHNDIQGNVISYNDKGINFGNSNKNNLADNLIENNTRYGIYLSGSDNNFISEDNYFLNNGQDILEKSPPPKIKIPGFELILLFVAIFALLFFKKKS
jgi:parallel beta-helix repeat protein